MDVLGASLIRDLVMIDEGGHPSDCMPLRSCCVVHSVCGESVMDLASKTTRSGGIAEESKFRILAALVLLRKADCLNAKAHVTWTCTESHRTPHSTLGKCCARALDIMEAQEETCSFN